MTKEQIDRFKGAAKKLGCDESEERFSDALRRVGRQEPKKSEKKEPRGEKPKSK